MVSEGVYDSQGEEENLEFSHTLMQQAIAVRCQRSVTSIDRSHAVDLDLFNQFEKLLNASETGHRLPPPSAIVPIVNENNVPDALDDEIMHYGRGTNKRNRSFYQQHIYTIDYVSHILRLGKEEATALVKNNEELVEKFHNGTLRQFLLKRKPAEKVPQNQKKKVQPKTVQGSQHSDIEIQQLRQQEEEGESYSDGSNHTTDESSSSSSEEESFQEDDPLQVTFRGRTYKSIDELARVSMLPKSYFSKEKSDGSTKVAKRNHTNVESRIGVARRTKALVQEDIPQSEPNFSAIFTTGDDSQEHGTFSPTDVSTNLQSMIVIGSDENVNDDRYLSHKEDTELFDGDDETFYLSQAVPNDSARYESDVEEERGFGGDAMLALGPRKMRKNNSQVCKRRRASSNSTLINSSAPRIFKRRSRGSLNGKSRSESKHSAVNKLARHSSSSKSDRISHKNKVNTIFDKSQSHAGKHGRLIMENVFGTLDRTKKSRMQPMELETKKSEQQLSSRNYFSLSPNGNVVLGRQAHTSTVVIEALGNEYAIIPKKTKAFKPASDEAEVHDPFDFQGDVKSDLEFKSHFTSTEAYKMLFTSHVSGRNHDCHIKFGKNALTLSKILPNIEDTLKDLFVILGDSSIFHSVSPKVFMGNCHDIIAFCCDLNVNEAKSLLAILDNFRFRLEAYIRSKGTMRDVEFYCIGLCCMLYYCSHRIFENNYLTLFDFNAKSKEVALLFFEFASYVSGETLREKLREQGLFSEAVSFFFLVSKKASWEALEGSRLHDLTTVKDLCARFPPEAPLWRIVTQSIHTNLNNGDSAAAKVSLMRVGDFVSLGWNVDEHILLTMYGSIKENRFKNFPGESCNPTVMSIYGLNRDTVVNLYLNLLLEYGRTLDGEIAGRFLERIVPVSKASATDSIVLCNRLNILLCLSSVAKKNFDARFSELVASRELSRFSVQKVLQAFQVLIEINTTNKLTTSMKFLKDLVEYGIEDRDFINLWANFMIAIKPSTLPPETQQNLMVVISQFTSDKPFLVASYQFIKHFISESDDEHALKLLAEMLDSLSPVLFPKLWMALAGKLTKAGIKSWSKLIHFCNFEDEPQVYSFMLNHSGRSAYIHERETILVSFIKNLIRKNYSPSMNSFIRELSKVDPKILSCHNALIQTNRLQITINFIQNILTNELPSARSRFLSVLVNMLKFEFDKAGGNTESAQGVFVKRVTEFVNICGSEYISTSRAFEILCTTFGISKKVPTKDSIGLLNLDGNVSESLRFLQEKLLSCLKTNQDVGKFFLPIIVGHSKKSAGLLHNITDSKLFVLCCSISAHIECLNQNSSCWVLLAELIHFLVKILTTDRNLTRVDVFCVLKTIQLFPFVLAHRNSRFEFYEMFTLKSIYHLLILVVQLLDGTNDLGCFLKLVTIFVSRDAIHEVVMPPYHPQFLIKTPESIKSMIIRSNVTSSEKSQQRTLSSVREELDGVFNKFVHHVDGLERTDYEYGTEP